MSNNPVTTVNTQVATVTQSGGKFNGLAAMLVLQWWVSIGVFAYFVGFGLYYLFSPLMLVGAFNLLLATGWLWMTTGLLINTPMVLTYWSLYKQRRYQEIERLYTRVLRVWSKLPVRHDASIATAASNLGMVRLALGDSDGAEDALTYSLEVAEKDCRLKKHYLYAVFLNNLACIKNWQGEPKKGHFLSSEALLFWRSQKTPGVGEASPLVTLGLSCIKEGDLQEARRYLEEARSALNAKERPACILPESFMLADINSAVLLALVNLKDGKIEEANNLTDVTLQRYGTKLELYGTFGMEGLALLADEYVTAKDYKRAEALIEIAYAVGREFPLHPDCKPAMVAYERLLTATGREAEIPDMKRWVQPVLIARTSD